MPSCPNCHAPLEEDANFCIHCGFALSAKAEEGAAAVAEIREAGKRWEK